MPQDSAKSCPRDKNGVNTDPLKSCFPNSHKLGSITFIRGGGRTRVDRAGQTLRVGPGASWCLLVPPGGSWWVLVPPGGSWWLLVAPGPGGSSCLPVAPGGSWWLPVAPGASWWLLVAPGALLLSLAGYWWSGSVICKYAHSI